MKGDCDGCNKPATFHLTEIIGGKKLVKHLCESCPKLQDENLAVKSHTPINELLTNFVTAHAGVTQAATGNACEACGMTWADFKQSGLLGCEYDYAVFEKELTPLVQRAHEGNTHHVGKVPTRKAQGQIVPRKRADLGKLRRELARAVEEEDYERAAKLRDQIRSAEENQ